VILDALSFSLASARPPCGRTSDAASAEPAAPSPPQVVGELLSGDARVRPDDRVRDVADLFLARRELEAVALVDGTSPVGLLTRGRLLLKLGRNFGYELYARKPVSRIAVPDPLVVPHDSRLAEALALALARPAESVYDDIVVVERGAYVGLVAIRDIVLHQGVALARSAAERESAQQRASDLEKVEQLRARFLAHATHELRSPVNAIAALAELLRMHSDRDDLEYVRHRLPLLLRIVATLRTTVTNMLDVSKLEAGRTDVAVTRVEVAPLLDEVAATARLLAGDRALEVRVDAAPSLVLLTDRQKLRQILLNLASNAVKFTERGTIVLGSAHEGSGARLWVSDTGIGIREEDVSRLFRPFGQLEDALTKEHEGTGLGLLITRSLAQLLGGRVEVASRHGEGSTFTLHLPPPAPRRPHRDHPPASR
jgi:signal transduction histidine kinase